MNNNKSKLKRKLLSADDISIFCAQIGLVLKSAIPLHDGIEAIYDNIQDKDGHEIIKGIGDYVAENGLLHEALDKAGVFPSYMVNMVRIGEKSGKLESVMESLSLYYEREDALNKRVKSAIVYPAALVLMMGVVITVLIVKVLPIFKDVFNSLGSEMSETSSFVMKMGFVIGQWVFVAIIILAVCITIIIILGKTQNGSRILHSFASRFFITRKLSEKVSSARFAAVMSMMLSSGYHTEDALELAILVVNNEAVKLKIKKCIELIHKGHSFSDSITQSNIFIGIYSRMVSIGAKTGSLDEVMERLAVIYGDQADESIEKAVSLIEPILVGLLCLIIGAILLTVMLPLMSIMSSIG